MSTIIEVMSEEYRYLLLKKLKCTRICHSKDATLMEGSFQTEAPREEVDAREVLCSPPFI
jgi:hypothetical protein